jgi:3-deoxy-D-manno-octulosonic-acid transferase
LRKKSGGDSRFWKGRIGRYDKKILDEPGSPRIWFHVSSVGEATGAFPILQELHKRLPNCDVTLTVATMQGYLFVMNKAPVWVRVLPFPLDFPSVVRNAFERLRPDVYIGLEGEFWPNLFRQLRRRRIPTLLLNGRLSSRSASRYRALWPLFRPIFKQFEWLAMHSEDDRQNALSVGAPPQRTLVLGSSKYDGLLQKVQPEAVGRWRDLLNINSQVPVMVGGSLRRSECIQLPEVFLQLRDKTPELIGIIAPRHMERIQEISRRLEDRCIPFQYLTRIEAGVEHRKAQILLVDRMGALFELYALGDLIFCGGTLEPIGGHNILEPAAWGKAVFYGPNIQKVFYEHQALKAAEGSFMVEDSRELFNMWKKWIFRLSELSEHGARARRALDEVSGVAAKQVDLIMDVLQGRIV